MPIRAGEYVALLKTNRKLKWTRVPGEPEGTTEVILHKHADGSYSHLLRIEKGVATPGVVVHDFYEEAYYIEGEMQNTKTGEKITAGRYVFHEPGEEHGPFRCLKTCVLLEFRYYK